jgi:cytochrome c peroxidase
MLPMANQIRIVVTAALLLAFPLRSSVSFPLSGDETVLPPGTELNEEALARPREVFHSEVIGGAKSYLVNLGDLAFNSPSILGGAAKQASVSCGTCHVNGAGNPKLFVPGHSTRPGNFDTTGALFNPKAHNAALDPVRVPSLRGARTLAPYGNDGRFASLRDFVRNVVVNEFAGSEASPAILDAMVAYIQDIDFLRNVILGPGGRLTSQANDAQRRGETLFFKPFPHQPELSCASCHIPSAAFVDHRQHDVGSGGFFKTPTLLNADFNGPYFHDGRFDRYDQVIDHFDRVFDLGLSAQDKSDLIAYLSAVGDGERPYERDGGAAQMKEINDFTSVLATAIPAHDTAAVSLVVATVGAELRELTERIPDRRNGAVAGGEHERTLARMVLKELVLSLRRIDAAASSGRFEDAEDEFKKYSYLTFAAVPAMLTAAEPYSLFNPRIHAAHYDALRQMLRSSRSSR